MRKLQTRGLGLGTTCNNVALWGVVGKGRSVAKSKERKAVNYGA